MSFLRLKRLHLWEHWWRQKRVKDLMIDLDEAYTGSLATIL